MTVPTSEQTRAHRLFDGGRKESWLFEWLCFGATWSSVGVLIVLLTAIAYQAWGWVDWQLLTSFGSFLPQKAGVLAGFLGTLWIIGFTILLSVPIGVGAAVYLEEYAGDNWLTNLIRVNLANLAAVPSIVYGILGLTAFVRMFGLFGPGGYLDQTLGWDFQSIGLWGIEIPLPLGRTIMAGSLTMTLLILPVIIIASQEALRAVPQSIRNASLALGATKWQTMRHQVIPAAIPGMMTGVILAISRAIGETAPLVLVGAYAYVNFAPGDIDSPSALIENPSGILRAPFDKFTTITIQIFNWVKESKSEFTHVAAAGIVVLLSILLALNAAAVLIRNWSNRHIRW